MSPRAALLLVCLFPGAAFAEPIDCVIEPKSVIDLVSSEKGRIDSVPVSRGDRVRRGDLLVQLDDAVQKLQVDITSARMESDVDVRAGEARRALREKEFDRATQLRASSIATAKTVEDAEVELTLTTLALEEAQVKSRLAKIEHAQAQALLERRRITSPVDAVVVSVEAAPGEFAHEQAALMSLAETDPLHVEVFVPGSYFERISVGDVYEVSHIAPLEGHYPATVTVVDPIFDAASGTFGVRLEIQNPDSAIPAGTRCQVDLDRSVAPAN